MWTLCQRATRKISTLVNIHTTGPMELACIDYLSLGPDSHNTNDILVITDRFTKYVVAIPTKDQKATTVAKTLWEQFFVHYGFPEWLLSDQSRDFESQLIKELCTLAGITKVHTKDKEKSHWRDFVKPLIHAYNHTKSDVTGFSTYEMMFGRQVMPAELVETPPELVEGEAPTVMVEQSPAEEDNTQMGMTNKLDLANETDKSNGKEQDVTNETDVEKDPVEVLLLTLTLLAFL